MEFISLSPPIPFSPCAFRSWIVASLLKFTPLRIGRPTQSVLDDGRL